MLAAELGLDERSDVFEVDGMLSMRDLAELAAIDEPRCTIRHIIRWTIRG